MEILCRVRGTLVWFGRQLPAFCFVVTWRCFFEQPLPLCLFLTPLYASRLLACYLSASPYLLLKRRWAHLYYFCIISVYITCTRALDAHADVPRCHALFYILHFAFGRWIILQRGTWIAPVFCLRTDDTANIHLSASNTVCCTPTNARCGVDTSPVVYITHRRGCCRVALFGRIGETLTDVRCGM
jgi:hypothetical protein